MKQQDIPDGYAIMYSARRRFRGYFTPVLIAVQVVGVYICATAVVTNLMAVLIACSALAWCVLAITLDHTSVQLFNTKEYFRILLNESTRLLEAAENQGFLPQKILEDSGTNDPDTGLKEENSGKQDTDTDT